MISVHGTFFMFIKNNTTFQCLILQVVTSHFDPRKNSFPIVLTSPDRAGWSAPNSEVKDEMSVYLTPGAFLILEQFYERLDRHEGRDCQQSGWSLHEYSGNGSGPLRME